MAVWFLALDTVSRFPFHTPAALGSVLFLGAQSAAEVRVNLAVVAAYTLFHVLAFCGVGTGFVWVAERIRRAPSRWLLLVLSFVVLEGLFVGTIGGLGAWVFQAMGWWTVMAANVIAVLTMAGAVWATTPELRRLLHDRVEPAV
ncbi:MAG: hypothetical protein HY560_14635 [Gemmatimonadetes bacterium]|nr:hypothetical protein [Gemmatimonadota bacterium]